MGMGMSSEHTDHKLIFFIIIMLIFFCFLLTVVDALFSPYLGASNQVANELVPDRAQFSTVQIQFSNFEVITFSRQSSISIDLLHLLARLFIFHSPNMIQWIKYGNFPIYFACKMKGKRRRILFHSSSILPQRQLH